MTYKNIILGRFLRRPNRFIAHCMVDDAEVICHVKNTGRCRELLTENATVILEKSSNPLRKTPYDLVAVYKDNLLINMDSSAPNKVFSEYIPTLFPNATYVKAEYSFLSSRFDFYVECGERKILIETKGVTLEENGICKFPDAPTERGIKHLRELSQAVDLGYECMAVFIVQMANMKYFTPNYETHAAFGSTLKYAQDKGVSLLALECDVTENSLTISKEIPIKLL